MGLGELVSSLFALNSDAEKERHEKKILFSRHKRSEQLAKTSPDEFSSEHITQSGPALIIDPKMHFAMNTARSIERCVFRLLSGRSSFTPGKEHFKTRDRAYSESEKDEIFADGEYRKVVQLLVDEACGEACVFIEKNHAGRLRVYAQFRRLGDNTVGQFSSDMPNNTDIGNCYKAGEITFGKVFRDR